MTNVGFATLSVIPSFSGFRRNLDRGTGAALSVAGAQGGERYGRSFSSSVSRTLKRGAFIGGLGAAFGIGSFITDSVKLEAQYGSVMNQMRVATQAPADELKRLDDLAIDLGKRTIFSANQAADAMLELAKNGIKPATIEGGALKSALTLAAAGGVDLTDAASTMGNALNAFGLKGGKAKSVAAALAGAANASSASVGSLAEGLQQSAATAADVGFNVQETTGILAAFANAGVAGSDAGTSLKTMLSRLVPQTTKAKKAMRQFGLDFVKSNGEFKSATEIAQELQDGLGGLSASERSAALNTIFGSDARRAATILTKQGAEGLKDYIKATSDTGAAQDLAKAKMEGTAGSIERLKGSWETTKLEFGKSIAPVAADFLDALAGKLDDLSPKLAEFGTWFTEDGVPKLKAFAGFVEDDVLPAIKHIGGFAKDSAGQVKGLMDRFNDLPDWVQKILIGGGVAAVAGKKLGAFKIGGSLLGGRGGLFSKGGSPARPLYVWQVNGGGGGVGKKAPLLGAGGSAGVTAALITAIAGGVTLGVGKVLGPDNSALLGAGSGGSGGLAPSSGKQDDFFNFDEDKTREQNERVERQRVFVERLGQEWLDTKTKANDYNMFIRNKLPGELKFTVLGWPVAQKQARDYLATLLQIRDLHMDTRLGRAGGSGTTPGSGIDPLSAPVPGRPHDGGKGGGGAGRVSVFNTTNQYVVTDLKDADRRHLKQQQDQQYGGFGG